MSRRPYSASPGFRGRNSFGGNNQASSVCIRARENTDREIHRHIRVLSASKDQIRRHRDDLSKEAANITVGLRDGGQMNTLLGSQINQYSRQMNADAASTLLNAIRKHVQAMQACSNELSDAMQFARHASEELTLGEQKLQHLESLVDCAIDIDIQCCAAAPVSNRAAHSVTISESPLFPGLTIDQTDSVLADSVDLCARAGRLTVMLRKATATADNLTNHSMAGLAAASVTQGKVLAEAYAVQIRQMNGLSFEHNKARASLNNYEAEQEHLNLRYNQVKKTLQMRGTAGSSLTLSRGRADVVKEALTKEKGELEARLIEIDRKCDALRRQVRGMEEERDIIEGRMLAVKKNAENCLKTQQLANQLSPMRSPMRR